MRYLFLLLVFVMAHAQVSFAQLSPELRTAAEKSIVYVSTPVLDSGTGGILYRNGSGVLISSQGHVLVSHHVVDPDDLAAVSQNLLASERDDPKFTTRGSVDGRYNLRPMNLVKTLPDLDVTLMKIQDFSAGSAIPATICLDYDYRKESSLWGFGYPAGQALQPVEVTVGSDDGRLWNVSSSFFGGMSGGPIFSPSGKYVVALIKGGTRLTTPDGNAQSIAAMQKAVPLNIASQLISLIPGNAVSDCSDTPSPAGDQKTSNANQSNTNASATRRGSIDPSVEFETGQSMYANRRFVEALGHFQAACEAELARSCFEAGQLMRYADDRAYNHYRALPVDYRLAKAYYERGCDGNYPRACTELGLLYSNGIGAPEDDETARALFERACSLDDSEGCLNLGYLQYEGLGGPKNQAQGAARIFESCQAGHNRSCEWVCANLRIGDGISLPAGQECS